MGLRCIVLYIRYEEEMYNFAHKRCGRDVLEMYNFVHKWWRRKVKFCTWDVVDMYNFVHKK